MEVEIGVAVGKMGFYREEQGRTRKGMFIGFFVFVSQENLQVYGFVGDWFVCWVYGFDLLENLVFIVLEFGEEHEEFNVLICSRSDGVGFDDL